MQTTRGASLTDEKIDTGPSVGHRPVGILLAIAAVVLALDVVSKTLAVQQLADRPPLVLLDGVLTLRLVRNPGAAFGIATGLTAVFAMVAVGVILVILRLAARLGSGPWAVALGLLLGGAAGNLIDRLLRAPGPFRGHVIDWIELPHWPVFNLADSAIVCGGLLAVVLSARGIQIDGTKHRTT